MGFCTCNVRKTINDKAITRRKRMIKLFDNGAYLLHGTELVEDNAEAAAVLASKLGSAPSKEEA